MTGEEIQVPAAGGLSKEWGDESVTIYVGPNKEKSYLHKKLLCSKSSYFKAKLASASQDDAIQSVDELEASPLAFDLFVFWLYKGICPSYANVGSSTGCVDSDRHGEILVGFYVLADRYELGQDVKDFLVAAVTQQNSFGFGFNQSITATTTSRLVSVAAVSSVQALAEDDIMRIGVIKQACKYLLPTPFDPALEAKQKWLEKATGFMDAAFHRQFPMTYHKISAEVISINSAAPAPETGEPGAKRARKEGFSFGGSNSTFGTSASTNNPGSLFASLGGSKATEK